jgi:N-acetylmuramoyl-L-alanine amidase
VEAVVLAFVAWLAGVAQARDVDPWPAWNEDPRALAAWAPDPGGAVSGVRRAEGGGTRVAMLLEGAPARWQARGVAADGTPGPWVDGEETFRSGDTAVVIVELGGPWDGAQLRRVGGPAPRTLGWDLVVPAYPDAGVRARAAMRADPAGPPPPLSAELTAIGVIPRNQWGARPTSCSSMEDDWYRMAIHHTAGGTTSGGTVQGAVQALQAYAQDSGTYCDIPYQFLVGVDGSLWEGRPEGYTSGATGGGNNDGNAAISFLGCFTESGCPGTPNDVTEPMIDAGQLIVQTLADMHGISMSDVRGHRDWPGNSTVCPGNWLYARLDDLRTPLTQWGATLSQSSWGFGSGDVVTVPLGETVDGWVEFQNSGTAAWTPEITNLAVFPRDTAHALADASWRSPGRVSTVAGATEPGAVGRFPLPLYGASLGRHTLSIGLVEEMVTWFADDLGPAEGSITLEVEVVEPEPDAPTVRDAALPGGLARVPEGACGCASTSGRLPAPLLPLTVLAAALLRRRRPA